MVKRKSPRENFEVIPQAPNYEINSDGIIRNRISGQLIKWQISPHNGKQITLRVVGEKKIGVTLPSLMWLLHGKLIGKTHPRPVVISKGTRSLRFDSCRQAALFISDSCKLNFHTCQNRLVLKKKNVGDWLIHYCY